MRQCPASRFGSASRPSVIGVLLMASRRSAAPTSCVILDVIVESARFTPTEKPSRISNRTEAELYRPAVTEEFRDVGTCRCACLRQCRDKPWPRHTLGNSRESQDQPWAALRPTYQPLSAFDTRPRHEILPGRLSAGHAVRFAAAFSTPRFSRSSRVLRYR